MWWLPIVGLLCIVRLLARGVPRLGRTAHLRRLGARPRAPVFATPLAAACACTAVVLGVLGAGLPLALARVMPPLAWDRRDPVNAPIGVARGVNPGRVVWVRDPDATDWAGPRGGDGHWWEPGHTDQAVVDSMVSRAVRWLAGKPTDQEAWDALLRHFNRARGHGDVGYRRGEKIAIKINLAICHARSARVDPATRAKVGMLDSVDTSQHVVLAVLRQLVNVVGVADSDITVGDPGSYFPREYYDAIVPEFPNVRFIDHWGFDLPGYVRPEFSDVEFHWSTPAAAGKVQDFVPVSFAEASYIINIPVLKGHGAGITVCAKNHYGSLIRNPDGWAWGERKDYYDLHRSLPLMWCTPGRGHYRALVDLMGHEELGGKTVLYLVDGLYGGYYFEGRPYKWSLPPFDGDWPSSLFASQDPVAIDSVAYDFLLAEWPGVVRGGSGPPNSLQGGAEDYLHEAALADNPPSGTFYDPEGDGTRLSSLGVHEHWNDPLSKQYSRDLGIGEGIELISQPPPLSSQAPGAGRTADVLQASATAGRGP